MFRFECRDFRFLRLAVSAVRDSNVSLLESDFISSVPGGAPNARWNLCAPFPRPLAVAHDRYNQI